MAGPVAIKILRTAALYTAAAVTDGLSTLLEVGLTVSPSQAHLPNNVSPTSPVNIPGSVQVQYISTKF